MNDRTIEMFYAGKDVDRFRMEILSMGLCDLFLPASLVIERNGYGMAYDTAGCRNLMQLRNVSASTLIGCVCSILDKSNQAARRYFFDGEYSLDPGVVFLKGKVPDAYLIYNRTTPRSRREVLFDLSRILKLPNRDPEGDVFLEKACGVLQDPGRSYFRITHELKQIGTFAYREGK